MRGGWGEANFEFAMLRTDNGANSQHPNSLDRIKATLNHLWYEANTLCRSEPLRAAYGPSPPNSRQALLRKFRARRSFAQRLHLISVAKRKNGRMPVGGMYGVQNFEK